MNHAVLLVSLAFGAHAFVPGAAPSAQLALRGRIVARSTVAPQRAAADDDDDAPPGVQFLTELATEEQLAAQEPGWVAAERYKAGVRQDAVNYGPTTYEGFVDSEGFDGGDGQVGVVGDGSNQMETFDTAQTVEKSLSNNAIGGKDSKSAKTKVAFGYSSGYADSLKDKGMVDVDEYGEDRMAARRQQLENWRNQQDVNSQRDQVRKYQVETAGGTFDRSTHQASHYLENNIAPAQPKKWGRYKGPSGFAEGVIVAEGNELQHGETFAANEHDVTEEVRMRAMAGGRGAATVLVRNDVMTYEDFAAGFAAGAPPGIKVTPAAGTLNGARGEPFELTVSVDGSRLAGGQTYEGFLVVDTEETKFTYKIVVDVQ